MRNLRPEPDSRISEPTGALRICRRWPPFLRYFRYEKAYRYKIVSSQRLEAVEKDVNVCLEQFGYDLYGSPFGRGGTRNVQALVKSEDVPATDVPSTLRPAVIVNLDQRN